MKRSVTQLFIVTMLFAVSFVCTSTNMQNDYSKTAQQELTLHFHCAPPANQDQKMLELHHIDQEKFKNLSTSHPKLQSLSLWSYEFLENPELNLKDLKTLDVGAGYYSYSPFFNEYSGTTNLKLLLKNCQNLEKLGISDPQISDEIIDCINDSCPNLTSLSLSPSKKLKNPRIMLKNLKTLDLGAELSEESLITIFKNAPHLEKLSLYNIYITQKVNQTLSKYCKNITHLELILPSTFSSSQGGNIEAREQEVPQFKLAKLKELTILGTTNFNNYIFRTLLVKHQNC